MQSLFRRENRARISLINLLLYDTKVGGGLDKRPDTGGVCRAPLLLSDSRTSSILDPDSGALNDDEADFFAGEADPCCPCFIS